MLLDFVGRATGQDFLCIDASMENQSVAKISFETIRFHTGCRRLHRIQQINAQVDQVGNQLSNTAAGTAQDLDPTAVSQIDQLPIIVCKEFKDHVSAKEQATLRTKIVTEISDVDPSAKLLEGSLIQLQIELCQARLVL